MHCFNHQECGHKSLTSTVLLLCDCLVCLCEDCARKMVLICLSLERKRRKVVPNIQDSNTPTYEALYCCPQCQFKVSTKRFDVLSGVAEALEAEENLLRAAMTSVSMSYDKHTTSAIDLQGCWTEMRDGEAGSASLSIPYDENEAIKVAKLRRGIATLALEQFDGYANPYDCITFTKNRFYRNNVSSLEVHELEVHECVMCKDSVQPGYSVQLTCTCNYAVCRTCVLINAHIRPDTYINGVYCTWCTIPSRSVFANADTVLACENALLTSAAHYLSSKLVAHRGDTDRNHYLNMIRLYWCVGYEGNINILDEKELSLGTITVPRLKLEVAKLEELRLSKCGVIDTYNIHYSAEHGLVYSDAQAGSDFGTDAPAGKFSIGFLHALQVKKNPFFEHFYTNSPATTTPTSNNRMNEWGAQCAKILSKLQDANKLRNSMSFIDLFDKIVLHALRYSTTYAPTTTSNTTSANTNTDLAVHTTPQVTRLLENFVYHKFTTLPLPNLQMKPLDDFMLNIVKKVNIAKSVESSLQKLVQGGYLRASGSGKDAAFSLDTEKFCTVQMDPALLDAAPGHVGDGTTKPFVSVPAASTASPLARAVSGGAVAAAVEESRFPSSPIRGAVELTEVSTPVIVTTSIVESGALCAAPAAAMMTMADAPPSYEWDYFADAPAGASTTADPSSPTELPVPVEASTPCRREVSRVLLRLQSCMTNCVPAPAGMPRRAPRLRKRRSCAPYPISSADVDSEEDLSDSDSRGAYSYTKRVYNTAFEEIEVYSTNINNKRKTQLAAIRRQANEFGPEVQSAIQTLRAILAAEAHSLQQEYKRQRKLTSKRAAAVATRDDMRAAQREERKVLAQQAVALQKELGVHSELLECSQIMRMHAAAKAQEEQARIGHAFDMSSEMQAALVEERRLHTQITVIEHHKKRLVKDESTAALKLTVAEGKLHDEKRRTRQVTDNRDVWLKEIKRLQQELDGLRETNSAELAEQDQRIQLLHINSEQEAKRRSSTANPHMMGNLAATLVHLEAEQKRLQEESAGLKKKIDVQFARKGDICHYIRRARQDILPEQDRAVSMETEKMELLEEQRELRELALQWEEKERVKEEQRSEDMQLLLSSFQC